MVNGAGIARPTLALAITALLLASCAQQRDSRPDLGEGDEIHHGDHFAAPTLRLASTGLDYPNIDAALAAASDGDTLYLGTGQYHLTPADWIDPLGGNLSDEDCITDIPVTVGLHIKDKALSIVGAGRDETTIVTNAGYGVLFENAGESRLMNLTVTGGIRDADGRATSAAVIAKFTNLRVGSCNILRNDRYPGKPAAPGVIGICAREGAKIEIDNCLITDNTWDGIAAYRSDPRRPEDKASLTIRNTTIRRGSGAGIGITWDASAVIDQVEISHYWKGIGAFGNTDVKVRNSFVHDQLGWGIIVTGEATMKAHHNVVASNGTVGMAAWNAEAKGAFTHNIVINNGIARREWVGKRIGVWMNSDDVTLLSNCIWNNSPINVGRGGLPMEKEASTPLPFIGLDRNFSTDPGLTGLAYGDPRAPENSALTKLADPPGIQPDCRPGLKR